jgi:predicted CopG family antitoxin
MRTTLNQVTVYLSDDVYERLRERAASEARSMSQIIARMLERKLPAPKPPKEQRAS